jgi:Lon protease-like protein
VGARRIRVEAWLPDAPYPVADVVPWPDPEPGPDHGARADQVVARLRRVLALATEAGEGTAPAMLELSDDPVLAVQQAAAVAPLGPFDHQRLLVAPTPEDRARLLDELLGEVEEVLTLRLSGG